MKVALALAALILLLPVAQALPSTQAQLDTDLYGSGKQGTPAVYPVAVFNMENTGTWSVNVDSPRYDTQASIYASAWILHVASAYLVDADSVGTYTVQFRLDSSNIAGCSYIIETFNAGGLLATTYQPYNFEIWCALAAPAYGSHTIDITMATAGTPDTILHGHYSAIIERTDYAILGVNQVLAGMAGQNGTASSSHAAILAAISAHQNLTTTQYNAIALTLTGFNATELQRYLITLQAIMDNATAINANINATQIYLEGKLGPPGVPVEIDPSPGLMAVILFALLAILAYFLQKGPLPFKFMVVVVCLGTFLLATTLGFNGMALLGMTASGALLTMAIIMLALHYKSAKNRKDKGMFSFDFD